VAALAYGVHRGSSGVGEGDDALPAVAGSWCALQKAFGHGVVDLAPKGRGIDAE
jgi:hypothetical protein